MKTSIPNKSDTPMMAKIKGLAENGVAAINGATQVDSEAIKSVENDAAAERKSNDQYMENLMEMYHLAKTDEEREEIREKMDELHEDNKGLGDKVRAHLDKTQDHNKKHNLYILSVMVVSFDLAYKFRKPLLAAAKKMIA